MLEVANLEVVYNDVILVLRGLSIEVPDGKIVALLGANGAGKTTTLRAISGLLDVHEGDITKGSITWNGDVISGKDPVRHREGRYHPGDGGASGLRRAHRRGEPADRRIHEQGQGIRQAAYDRTMELFPVLADAESRQPATCPVASSRCSQSAER